MNEIERDRRLDTAWRAASPEVPPSGLDAAIRTAARRAVGAGHGPSRNMQWWYPLAAAATVAVLAIGIAQMAPPEQVAPTVARSADAPEEARQDGERRSAAFDAKPPSTHIVAPAAVPSTPFAAKPSKNVSAGTNASVPPRAAAKTLQGQRESPPQDSLAGGAPELPATSTTAAGTIAPAPSARSEPFPGGAREEDRRGAPLDERLSAENAPAGSAAEPRQPQSRMATASAAGADEARTQDLTTRSVEEWIRRIRNLKNAGRADEAAKELAAFRVTYGDRADALLPPDLQPGKHPER
jgi:hypothetical protein